MIQANQVITEMLNSPLRQIKGRVELYDGSTHLQTFNYDDFLQSFTIERVGEENKFFGFGICQKLTLKLVDRDRQINITKGNTLDVAFGVEGNFVYPHPLFYIDDIKRDENTNELTITAYCALYDRAAAHKVGEIELPSYTIRNFALACGSLLDIPVKFEVTKNLCPNIDKWTLVNGAYIEDGYIVLPNTNSQAYVYVDWKKRNSTYTISATTNGDEASYNVHTSFYYYDSEGVDLSNNGDFEANLTGETHYEYVRPNLGDVYNTAIGNAEQIRIVFQRSANYAPTLYKFKDVMFADTALPYEPYADESVFDTYYENGANFEGTETIREALNDIAEATQTIYYIDSDWNLVFKRLSQSGDADLEITKANYFTLDTKDAATLSTVVHATELGDNVSAAAAEQGATQYVRDNAFWEMREDIADLVDNALAAVGGTTINQFECSWRGNFLLEVGDKIALTTKDDAIIYTYLLNDTITYNGGLSQKSQWSHKEESGETASNPSTLGEAIKQTYARVDKQNKQIDLVASEVDVNKSNIANLQINVDGINASVSSVETKVDNQINTVNDELVTIKNTVDAKMSSEDVTIAIRQELINGASKVETETGYRFDDEGLTISKTGSEMKTQVTDDGMTVYRDNQAVLVANNEGVKAEDLHATTFIIIGENSRLETWKTNRTACFWIGS